VALFAPHHAYGAPEDFKRFVNACHAAGLAVILDVVYNHLGPEGNYLRQFGPYFTDRYRTPWGDAVNLDGSGSDEVRAFLCDNASAWLRDYHCDGLRIDAVHALFDTSATHFLEQLSERVDSLEATLGRHLVLIAESDLNDARIVRSRDAGGYGLDAQWSDDLHHALHVALTGEVSGYYADFGEPSSLTRAYTQPFVYQGERSSHRRRHHGRPAYDVPGWRFVVCAQNHDQIGNRPHGDRLAQLVTPGRAKIAAALVLCAPYVPLIFQGEEWAASTPFLYFSDHGDPELGRQVSQGRRLEFAPFGWPPESAPDPQSAATFDASRLRWDERTSAVHADMLAWYTALIALRRQQASLRNGRYEDTTVTREADGSVVVLKRESIAVICNLGHEPRTVVEPSAEQLLLASDPRIALQEGSLTMPAESVGILQVRSLR
jgi:maltooligosyltrehalose trehalohydrolase